MQGIQWELCPARTDIQNKSKIPSIKIQNDFAIVAVQSPSCVICDLMEGSIRGLPIPYHLWNFAQVDVHGIVDVCCPLLLLCPQPLPTLGYFPVSQLFTSCGQSIWVSASVLPMSFQGGVSLGLTGLIQAFSSTVEKHQFFSTLPSLWSN